MNSRRVFWGTVLILGGIFFFLKQSGILFFHIDWLIWRRIWPVFIVLAGIRLLLPRENKAVGILLILTLFGVFAYSVFEGIRLKHEYSGEEEKGFHFPFRNFDKEDKEDSDKNDAEDGSDSTEHSFEGRKTEQTFKIPLDRNIKSASLSLNGGAAFFTSDVTHSDIFSVSTKLIGASPYRMENSTNGDHENIKLISDSQNGNLHFDDNKPENKVNIRLNPDFLWNLDLNVGAGKVDYDFSGYKMDKLVLNTGLSDVHIKLGRLSPQTEVNVDAGLAKFDMEIPKSSGCKIHSDGGLNQQNFEGFVKIDDRTYKTSDYEGTDRKIEINFSGGISQIQVRRY